MASLGVSTSDYSITADDWTGGLDSFAELPNAGEIGSYHNDTEQPASVLTTAMDESVLPLNFSSGLGSNACLYPDIDAAHYSDEMEFDMPEVSNKYLLATNIPGPWKLNRPYPSSRY